MRKSRNEDPKRREVKKLLEHVKSVQSAETQTQTEYINLKSSYTRSSDKGELLFSLTACTKVRGVTLH